MATADEAAPRWRELAEAGVLGRATLLCLSVWLHAADGLVVATVVPTATAEIGGVAFLNWTFLLYELGSIVAGAGAGLAAATFGIRRMLCIAAGVYAAGCAVSALAPDMAAMLAGRVIQGFGGGGLVAVTFVALNALFPRRFWNRIIALVSGVWGVSALCGPLVGSLFVELGWWRGAFWAFAVQAIILLAIMRWRLDEVRPDAAAATRFPGARLAILTLSILAIAGAGLGLGIAPSVAFGLAGLAGLAVFLRLDARAPERMLPRAPVDPRRAVGTGLVAMVVLSIATVPFALYGPLLIVQLHGGSALHAAALLAGESLAWSIVAILVSDAPPRHERLLIVGGAGAIALGVAGFAAIMPLGPVALLVFPVILVGGGFGASWGFMLRWTIERSPAPERALVGAALPTSQRIGYAIGEAVAGIVANGAGLAAVGTGLVDLRAVASWVFVAFVPFVALGALQAVRLTRFPLAADLAR
jgi:MFS family permease